jgi:CubicO group peptidase (beta-lactamase class C family)
MLPFKNKIIPVVFALCLFISIGLQAQPDMQAVQQNVADRLAEENLLGISIAYIYSDGRRQFINRGSLSTSRDETVDESTIFEIGSISKTFMVLMMTKMAEEGMFSLDTPIEKLLPETLNVPSYEGKKITLRHLATHTSGLPSLPANFAPGNDLNPYADYTISQMYAFLDGYKLDAAPESSVAYSNYGAGLLGHLLELASGETYHELLQTYITGPLGMDDTGIDVSEKKLGRFAKPYNYGNTVSYWNFPTLAGAGGIRSTAEDMAIYMKAQLGLQVSNLESAIQKTHAIQFDAGDGVTDAIGLGWFQSTENDTLIWHNGGTGGFSSFAGFNNEDGIAVVVLTNGKDNIDDIGLHLLDEQHALNEVEKTASVDSATIASYTGTYSSPVGMNFYVSSEEDQLWVQLTGQPKNKVFPESEQRFFYRVVDAEIEFSADSAGSPQKLTLYQNGQEIAATKTGEETAPPERKVIEIDPALLDRYTGTYQLQPGFNIIVTKEGDHLMTQVTGQQKFPVFPESENKFFLKVVDAQIEFITNENGDFKAIKLYQGGRVMEGKRVEK